MFNAEVLAELTAREPIFHRPAFASTRDDFDRLMAPGYWEIGASGTRYDRAFILDYLEENPPVDAHEAGWSTFNHQARPLGPETWLFTYVLDQGKRRARRATVWQRTPDGWQILYHQGTLIAPQPPEESS